MESHHRFTAVGAMAALIVLGGCVPGSPKPWHTQVNARVRSPDGKWEAIYAEDIGGGAAVGVTEEVFVAQPGTFPHLEERVFSEECARNIVIKWENPRLVTVSYDISADIKEFPTPYTPSISSIFSSGYWTFGHPHGIEVHFDRRLTPAGGGC